MRGNNFTPNDKKTRIGIILKAMMVNGLFKKIEQLNEFNF